MKYFFSMDYCDFVDKCEYHVPDVDTHLELFGYVPHHNAAVACGRGNELVTVGVTKEGHFFSTL